MVIFIIPLIALAVWILQYVFKGPEDNKQQQGRPRNAAPRTNLNKPRRQVNDLDRFLEETRKRKQDEERKPVVIAEMVPDQPPDRAEALERERRAASKPKPQPQTARAERRSQRPTPPREQPRQFAAPVPVMVEPIAAALAAVPVHQTAREMAKQARMDTPPSSTPATRPRQASPLLSELVSMLRKPQGIALAMVLREVLDAPVSRRPLK